MNGVPVGYELEWLFGGDESTEQHLRWLDQKFTLAQDVFLVSRDATLARWVALRWAATRGRPIQHLLLTPDTAEGDLKQRREIVAGGTSAFHDEVAVRAAVEGHILVLEGLERAERNVLPLLNNLLENREMQLEDGRFLCESKRYDRLVAEGNATDYLVRVHPEFRVLAIGAPVPPVRGHPLDPPLRSRFQARRIDAPPLAALARACARAGAGAAADAGVNGADRVLDPRRLRSIIGVAGALLRTTRLGESATASTDFETSLALPPVAVRAVVAAARLSALFPSLSLANVFSRVYPSDLLAGQGTISADAAGLVSATVAAAAASAPHSSSSAPAPRPTDVHGPFQVAPADPGPRGQPRIQLSGIGAVGKSSRDPSILVSGGRATPDYLASSPPVWFRECLQSLASGQDLCLVGQRGGGKTRAARLLALTLGYGHPGGLGLETMFVYADMSARSLLQRRATTASGVTVWADSPLTRAARTGSMCVLDGIQRLPLGTLASLHRLIDDRTVSLPDGTRLVRADDFDRAAASAAARAVPPCSLTQAAEQLNGRGLFRLHPSFRLVVLALPPLRPGTAGGGISAPVESGSPCWLDEATMSKFLFHRLPFGGHSTEAAVCTAVPSADAGLVGRLCGLANRLAHIDDARESNGAGAAPGEDADLSMPDQSSLSRLPVLTIRTLIRLAKRSVHWPNGTAASLAQALMLPLAPEPVVKMADQIAAQFGLRDDQWAQLSTPSVHLDRVHGSIQIGQAKSSVNLSPAQPSLVPSPLFFEIPAHLRTLESLLKDWELG